MYFLSWKSNPKTKLIPSRQNVHFWWSKYKKTRVFHKISSSVSAWAHFFVVKKPLRGKTLEENFRNFRKLRILLILARKTHHQNCENKSVFLYFSIFSHRNTPEKYFCIFMKIHSFNDFLGNASKKWLLNLLKLEDFLYFYKCFDDFTLVV